MVFDIIVFFYLLFCLAIWKVDIESVNFINRYFEGIQIAGVLLAVGCSGLYLLSGQLIKFLLILPVSIYLQAKFKKFKQER
ncbi:hypothetical protein N478_26095 [Pseudoalteromonas luteoviolacea S4060-1]|uniref:Uncharacterized protein n=1 Tax=Pseudoalteromonas luteoviolacea S4060-1 TaxID=1365257 RepID=A0A161Y2B5_9GAMM|nr:hypothetical protein N478_26095 [Pseudoalteromonas luteoviolacea S4060-1]